MIAPLTVLALHIVANQLERFICDRPGPKSRSVDIPINLVRYIDPSKRLPGVKIRSASALDPHLLKVVILQAAFILTVGNASQAGPLPSADSSEAGSILLAKLPETAPANSVAVANNLPVLVFIHSKQCPVCAKVRPIMQQLEKTYDGKVQFVFLDVTDDHTKASARELAKSKGLAAFFALYEDTFPCVGVFNTKKKCIKELYGFQTKEKYISTLEKVLSAHQ